MNKDELILQELLAKGEDTCTQFKENIFNVDQLAQEMVAFSNSMGGTIVIGVTDRGEIKGLTDDDKRKMSQDELRRLFQDSGKLYADETIFKNASFKDIDLELFRHFHQKKYGIPVEETEAGLSQAFENLNLASNGYLNMAGLLLFGKNPMKYIPISQIIAVSFLGNDITGREYRDSENIEGNLKKLYADALAFLKRNLKKIQKDQDFNSVGELEIPPPVLDELLINALIHRDYFISSNIRILIFDNRIEIINPGKLPHNLTVEKIKRGISVKRNNTLASFAFDLIPYRGVGSGILRALQYYPDIEFINDVDLEQFKAIIKRP